MKVTIVVPTYNAEKFIIETIQSCLNQTHKNLSVVVIDDNSKDNTLKLLEKFCDNITIIKNTKNYGLPRNINKVILDDNSDFFIYLGHDDILSNDHVTIMLNEFEDDVVAIHCNSKIINGEGVVFDYTKNNELQLLKTDRIHYELAKNNFISIVGMMHRTDSFKSIGGWDSSYDLYGEWLYYINLSTIGRIKYSEKTFSYYRHHNSNVSQSLYDDSKLKSFFLYKKRCRMLAYSKCKNLTLIDKLNFRFINLLEFLRSKKSLRTLNKIIFK
ncbi:hypothetical protein OA92_03255 [Marinomonas sp. SBI22]|uniref:glycosyltransferase family 2 protein n=1 Tax=unclassified Marinomonas TaxID=196814 RepID=UPI0007AFD76F|nr:MULTISPECIES: glycosyltransferase family 2 protein [unclassified Marinomonas]KZM44896.1 hypothetical protein OA92_03255 [Marinomonas sp. SBI22]KZM46595.1 hypothetical protein OA91_02315 [Marinomonas sp. SBI8L]